MTFLDTGDFYGSGSAVLGKSCRRSSPLSPTGWHFSGSRGAVTARHRNVVQSAPPSPPSVLSGPLPWHPVSPVVPFRPRCRQSRYQGDHDYRDRRTGSARQFRRAGFLACGNCRDFPRSIGRRPSASPRSVRLHRRQRFCSVSPPQFTYDDTIATRDWLESPWSRETALRHASRISCAAAGGPSGRIWSVSGRKAKS